jgi:glycosyltransferase involved in cell wall biosynthesis
MQTAQTALDGDGTAIILLATRNGAAHLDAQLQSIVAQAGCDWRLIASDDGSADATPEILARFQQAMRPGQVQVRQGSGQGPGQGATENFRFLLSLAPPGTAIAYCDQDDIWLPDKLARALAALRQVPAGTPALYGSTVQPTDDKGNPLGKARSRVPKRPLGLRNALVQNVFQGNTIVLNAAAATLLQDADVTLRAAGAGYVLHDWWAYILVAAAGGTLIFDATPSVLYRQHDGNLIGTNDGFFASLRRMVAVLKGRNAAWLTRHLDALQCLEGRLPAESRLLLAQVRLARRQQFLARIAGIRQSGLYMQRRGAQAGLWMAALTGRI